MQDFTNKLAVITGGASGVGRSLAFALGAEGARVLIADVDQAALSSTVADLAEQGIEAHSQVCDVTSADSVNQLAAKAYDELGGAHLIFANAGVAAGEAGPIWGYADNDWKWCFDVNFWGVVNTINAFMPRLVTQEAEDGAEAHIMITGSGNGAFLVYPDQPVYSATKAAVQAVTEALYQQMQAAGSKVKVHALFPGPHVVETGIFDSDRVRPEHFAKAADAPDSGIRNADDLRELMESYGAELHTTHPDEVAQTALQGIRDGQFWVVEWNDQTRDKVETRMQSILNKTNPVPAVLG
ncbi:MAG: SDR family NAD(P)-dependent oxidoreductase [Gammaproteobacteria bacterium]|nr:SDR family NAD(P)-dependent oxidoreductase [Gammaproteobacteria bacterium]